MYKQVNIIRKDVTSADGTKLYADAVGDPSHPALVFIHGFGAGSAAFSDLFANPEYSKELYLIRYDLRAFGRSGKPTGADVYASKKYAEDFAAVLKAFDAKTPILVGWSMGGTVITDVTAHLPPDTLSGCVTLAGSPFKGPAMQNATTASFSSVMQKAGSDITSMYIVNLAANRLLFLRDGNPSPNFIEETIQANNAGDNFWDENPDVPWETRCRFMGMGAFMPPSLLVRSSMREQDTTKLFELAKQGFPLLFVYGTHDAYMSGEKILETMVRPIFTNLEEKVIENGGHVPFLDRPQEVMDAISKFVKRVLST
ncbi:hypothetical protein M0805_008228 [Coniferiporia weirii]|nr:hypothetical protein M0805_008228 [Coniferiporia weirii]